VIEIHAKDRPGLFYRLCAVFAAHDCSVRSAHVSTWATEAVDVFYLQPLAEPDQVVVIRSLEASLRAG
jgi:[protein-PII] uridylyltransferase